ncbi:ATP-dependent RNA helicase HrpA [Pleionea sp. CnH1-48]|uniref:ATP-dependent RNA helicase HrpA n=1 Tax=Pleionea sp. CnH1-48 TaxID=2954494 RepID=UPI0020978E88|nr:ATP-dependent RNA helicase HrpA [Pleionea sp. CnH1-48]
MSSESLFKQLKGCLTKDAGKLISLRKKIKQREQQKQPVDRMEQSLQSLLEESTAQVVQRREKIPELIFPENLPVSEAVDEIQKVIEDNQVVILAGETGSGKTTQLPKICLRAGLGARGLIGHTQPRRVAATSVANRIAEEVNTELGQLVGVSVRFHERMSEHTLVKVMTDGMLLTEIQHDPMLSRYEVIIIDEAHERSINIDFLLGYLKQLLPRRKDLKLIITSATIDVERFSKHFSNAPTLTVEGRTYPVEMRYLSTEEMTFNGGDDPETAAICHAVQEAVAEGPGDILIFLPGEGEIRRTAKQLRRLELRQTEILPLYARLSIQEQQKVFKPLVGRKIVLATNVAETSLTVPGIRFVIDPGTARISRFSMRSKIQRLPVEKISQASANQRAGRCGRVSAGICFRLYSEDDFVARPEFTLPEIKRTNLASVILQMKSMRMGDFDKFPFIEPPEERHWRDGINLLFELGALDKQQKLTALGKQISRLPVDPKLAVMLVSAKNNALQEVLVIASFFSIRDPRERPHDKRQKADECHQQWSDDRSDFISIVKLWNGLHKQQDDLTNREFKTFCGDNFINFPAWLEWRNTYRQLKQMMLESGAKLNSQAADYEAIHKALLPALLSNVLMKTTEAHYQGARNTKVFVHPASLNFKKKSQWLLASELVETERLYARTTAPINSEWIEPVAEHVAKINHLEPHWRKKRGEACAYLQKSLFGLIYVSQRLTGYSEIEPELSRRWLIEKGFIDGELVINSSFQRDNQQLLEGFKDEESKQRRTDILKPDEELYDWFEQRLPPSVNNQKTLIRWIKKDSRKHNRKLTLSEDDVLNPTSELDPNAFPSQLSIRGSSITLEYHFDPGHKDDGVNACLPVSMLNQFQSKDFEWLVPGLLREKILCSIKGLPKKVRKNFIPAPEFADACFERLKDQFGEGDFFERLAEVLYQISGVRVEFELWRDLELPPHLCVNYKVFADRKSPIAKGRDLTELQTQCQAQVKQALSQTTKAAKGEAKKSAAVEQKIKQWNAEFSFSIEQKKQHQKHETRLLQALQDYKDYVQITPCESRFQAENMHLRGVCRLLVLSVDKSVKYFFRSWQDRRELSKLCTQVESYQELVDDLAMALAKRSVLRAGSGNVENYLDYRDIEKTFSDSFTADMNEYLSLLLELLRLSKKVSHQVYDRVEPRYIRSYQDIRQQLDFLWKSGFLYEYGVHVLTDYTRYFSALEKRLERMDVNFPREEQCLRSIRTWQEVADKLADSPHNKEYTEAKVTFLWMLQEFRVSLFAQGVKTAYAISDKRLEKQRDIMKKLL